MKQVLGLLVCLSGMGMLLAGCGSSPLGKKATGMIYEVVVVMEQREWDGTAGDAVRAELLADVPGLPQSEQAMKVIYTPPARFDGMLTYVRNILLVNVAPERYTKVSLHGVRDRWASGQSVVTLNAPLGDSLAVFLHAEAGVLVNHFSTVERERLVALLEKDYNKALSDKVGEKFGISLKLPSTFSLSRDEAPDFFWASNNATSGRTDLVVYTFPYRDADTFTADYLIAKRDSVMKRNMPGAFPNSYMATETTYIRPTFRPLKVDNGYCGELRGLWRVAGDMMGGPFVSHARLDESKQRVVVVEGFVYAPETEKKNYIRRIEAALYTLQLLCTI